MYIYLRDRASQGRKCSASPLSCLSVLQLLLFFKCSKCWPPFLVHGPGTMGMLTYVLQYVVILLRDVTLRNNITVHCRHPDARMPYTGTLYIVYTKVFYRIHCVSLYQENHSNVHKVYYIYCMYCTSAVSRTMFITLIHVSQLHRTG